MRLFICFVILIASFFSTSTWAYNVSQEKLRSGIENYLRSKGYSVEQREDGLKFVDSGTTYFIEIDPEQTKPMFVRLARYVKFDDNLKRENVMKNLVDYNGKYAVKVYCKERNVILTGDMFVTNSEQFNYAFDDLLSLMKSAYNNINN